MAYEILKGSTDVTRYVMIVDSADGSPETGVTIADLDLSYLRAGSDHVAKVDAIALATVDAAHADNKMIEVDATLFPGIYRVDWPDAAFVTGVSTVILSVTGAGFHPAIEEIQLVSFNPDDAVRLGLTALPNAAADAAGGLAISDAGGLDLDAKLANINKVLGAVAGKCYRNAGGTQIKFYDNAEALLSTLDWNAGTTTWDVTWA